MPSTAHKGAANIVRSVNASRPWLKNSCELERFEILGEIV